VDVDNASTADLARAITNGEAFSDDFNGAPTASSLWSAIVRSVSSDGQGLMGLGVGDDLSKLTAQVPVHIQRLLGALLSVAEMLAQVNNNNVSTLVSSLHRVLGADFPETHMLDLFQNYRSYFPYSYMFIRRIGRTPNAPARVWEKVLSAETSLDTSDVIRRGEAGSSSLPRNKSNETSDGEGSDDNHDDSANNIRMNDRSDPKWLVSDSEEGEDSEDEEDMVEQKARHHAHQKKRMTRMSASPARPGGANQAAVSVITSKFTILSVLFLKLGIVLCDLI
jgi:hypothetical protein